MNAANQHPGRENPCAPRPLAIELPMTTLLLVDGSSYLFRAFHALPDLRSPQGEPTGALFGMIGMLKRLASEFPADYIAVVFDAKGKTFRDQWYPEYKANRSAMPEDLEAQIEPIHAAVRGLGWPLVMVDGVEADDVIGTLARDAAGRGIDTLISTSDKDMAQLVDERVTLINNMAREGYEKSDREAVIAKFGVPPERMIDYLTLVGDAVDNVPGVDKVGPKTAAKWLNEYGSLEGVITNADKIGGVAGENLRRALDWLPTARKLVTIKTDVPLPVAVNDLARSEADRVALLALYERAGFKTWRR